MLKWMASAASGPFCCCRPRRRRRADSQSWDSAMRCAVSRPDDVAMGPRRSRDGADVSTADVSLAEEVGPGAAAAETSEVPCAAVQQKRFLWQSEGRCSGAISPAVPSPEKALFPIPSGVPGSGALEALLRLTEALRRSWWNCVLAFAFAVAVAGAVACGVWDLAPGFRGSRCLDPLLLSARPPGLGATTKAAGSIAVRSAAGARV